MRIGDGLHVFGRAPEPDQLARTAELLGGSSGVRSLPLQRGGQGGDRSGPSSILHDPHPTFASRRPPSPLQGEGSGAAAKKGRSGSLVNPTPPRLRGRRTRRPARGARRQTCRPGAAGSPWRGRRDVLPTGRNLYTRRYPRGAEPQRLGDGKRLADEVAAVISQDHGDWPKPVMHRPLGLGDHAHRRRGIFAWRCADGRAPVWDTTSDRVTGFEVVTLARARAAAIDVTLRISGLFRDVFPTPIALFDRRRGAGRARRAAMRKNPYRRSRRPRVFGPAPGRLRQATSTPSANRAGDAR